MTPPTTVLPTTSIAFIAITAASSTAHRTSSDRSASRVRVLARLPTATLRPRIEARGERSTNADTLDRFAMTAFDDDDSTGAIGLRLRPTGDQWHQCQDAQDDQHRENRPEKFHRCGWPHDSLKVRRNPTPRSRPTREFPGPHLWWD